MASLHMARYHIDYCFTGDVVDVFYSGGTDETPLWSGVEPLSTFTGFRIAPA